MTIWERIQSALEPQTAVPEDIEHQLRLATGALLLEMCRADFRIHYQERRSIVAAIRSGFGLSLEETRALVEEAEAQSEWTVSLQVYTSLIKEYAGRGQKLRLIEDLWRVAYADGELHALEERLVRRVADLLELPGRSVEQARLKVAATAGIGAGGDPR